MKNQSNKLIYSIKQQLECEKLLGGKWLPKGNLKKLHLTAEIGTSQNKAIQQDNTLNFMTPQAEEIMNKSQKLKKIALEVSQCKSCELHLTRTNVVPGEGNSNARLVFVGEAPGQSEDEKGRPFIGRAGQLLENIIQAMGLSRDEVYICNILKCRPPGNRDPLAAEVNACKHFLYDQLNTLKPDIIVALGTHAAHNLLETNTPIGKLRGSTHIYHPDGLSEPIKLVATYHPAYLLRNYTKDARQKVWQDMQIVLKELKLPIPKKSS